MKIAMLAPFEESVPPTKYGGTELVVYNLVEGLVALGHEVFLLATGDSKTSATLEQIFPRSIRNNVNDSFTRESMKYVGLGKVIGWLNENQGNYDIIHNHIGWRLLPFAGMFKAPIITTLHGPLSDVKEEKVYRLFKKENYTSISLDQSSKLPSLNFIANVYNGIDFDKFEYSTKKGNYLAFLGRMSPTKGPLEAIKIARSAGVKLKMAAKIDMVDREYYEKEILPLIDGVNVEYVGEIGHEKKVEFLKNAMALIAPIQWDEPFGLIFIEAMACGTPVIANKRGSVPEVVKHGVTGFHCISEKDALEAILNIDSIDRQSCRDYSYNQFHYKNMVEGYIKSYESLLK